MAGLTLPELHAISWSQVTGPILVGATLLTLTSSGLMGGPAPALLWLGLGALVIGVGVCLDDPSAMVTGACPASRRRRTLERMLVPLGVVVGWSLFAALIDGRNGLSGESLALTGTGSVLAVLAVADGLRRYGVDEPGTIVGSAALLAVVGCLLFQPFREVQILQAYDDRGSAAALWWVATAVAVASLAWSTSDPVRR